jgi:hypothetical protein
MDTIQVPVLDTGTIAAGPVLWISVAVVLVLYVGLGIMLAYHWLEYMRYRTSALAAISMYALVGVILFSILSLSAVALL